MLPQIAIGEDDGTKVNDRLARYIIDSLNSGFNPEDPKPEEGLFLNGREEGDELDPAILICDPDFEVRLEISDTENPNEDKALACDLVPSFLLIEAEPRFGELSLVLMVALQKSPTSQAQNGRSE